MIDRLPPHSLEAEQALLGCALVFEDDADRLLAAHTAADFYHEPHRRLFSVVGSLVRDREPVDAVSVITRLRADGGLESVGGAAYLTELQNAAGPFFGNYSKIVSEQAGLRRVIEATYAAQAQAYEQEALEEVLAGLEQGVQQVRAGRGQVEWETADAGIFAAFCRATAPLEERRSGLPTGFAELDWKLAGGLQPQDLVLLAARPGVGKTAMLGQIAEHAASAGYPVGIFSLEMPKAQLNDRLLGQFSGIPLRKLRMGPLTESESRRVGQVADRLRKLPIHTCDRGELNVYQLRAEARRMIRDHGIKVFLLDYVQRIHSQTRAENRNQELAAIARALKSAAKETGVPWLVVSSLRRPRPGNEKNAPTKEEMRDSGELEFEADVVLLLHRKGLAEGRREWAVGEADEAELIIDKCRNGEMGVVKLAFEPTCARFSEWTGRDDAPPEAYGDGRAGV